MILVTGQNLVLTPEKVVVSYTIAGFGSRFLAALLDLLFLYMALIPISMAVSFMQFGVGPEVTTAVLLFGFFAGFFAYFIVQEWLWNGRTLGKRLLGLRVMMVDGTPITPAAAVYRGLLLLVDMIPPITGLITMFTNEKSQRVGDLVAGTMVVHVPKLNFGFTPAPHRYGIHPFEESTPELKGMTLEEYLAIKRLCDRFPDLPPAQQAKSMKEIWDPFAERFGIKPIANVHPIYQMEAVVMKYGRLNNLI